jgi:hypothetical protein
MAKKDSNPKKAAKNAKKAVKNIAKKAAKKVPMKPTAKAPKKKAKKPTAAPAPATAAPQEIAAEAYRIYLTRLEQDKPGDEFTDWIAAEAALKTA